MPFDSKCFPVTLVKKKKKKNGSGWPVQKEAIRLGLCKTQLIPETFVFVGMMESCAGVKGNAGRDSFRSFKKKEK